MFKAGVPAKAAPISKGIDQCLPERGMRLPQPVVAVKAGRVECKLRLPVPESAVMPLAGSGVAA
jgi:hypothetical protein